MGRGERQIFLGGESARESYLPTYLHTCMSTAHCPLSTVSRSNGAVGNKAVYRVLEMSYEEDVRERHRVRR